MQHATSAGTAAAARATAYRRLALAILGLDVPTLHAGLHAQRFGQTHPSRLIAPKRRRLA
jgi:hypothetical protein